MNDHAAFLAAIIENPADDSPRLIFADFLEDSDPARAEFIRVQCELANIDYPLGRTVPLISGPTDCDEPGCPCRDFHRRERELLTRYGNKWVPKILRHPKYRWRGITYDQLVLADGTHTVHEICNAASVTFRRGFISAIKATCQAWRDHGPAICRECPVEEVRLVDEAGVIHQPPSGLPNAWLRVVSTRPIDAYLTQVLAIDADKALIWAREEAGKRLATR